MDSPHLQKFWIIVGHWAGEAVRIRPKPHTVSYLFFTVTPETVGYIEVQLKGRKARSWSVHNYFSFRYVPLLQSGAACLNQAWVICGQLPLFYCHPRNCLVYWGRALNRKGSVVDGPRLRLVAMFICHSAEAAYSNQAWTMMRLINGLDFFYFQRKYCFAYWGSIQR
jgi:hypothetical protein